MDFSNLPKFKEWAITKGFSVEEINKYYCGGSAKREEMFKRGDEQEIEIKFRRWCGIMKSYENPDSKRNEKKEITTMYSAIINHIKTASTVQLNLVIQQLEDIIGLAKQKIEDNKESDIKSKEQHIQSMIEELKLMGIDYELIKK